MDYFLSCDWGTSAFRLRLVRTHDLAILAEEKSDQGIAATFREWQSIASNNKDARQSFYLSVIAAHISRLQDKQALSLRALPVVLSGMASSSIGITEMPYRQLPFSLSGEDLNTEWIRSNAALTHDVLLISGVCSDDDVMRGEETQLIGCVENESGSDAEKLYIFPGTHSKHILIRKGHVVAFSTYMTGELFSLLSTKSILSASVQVSEESSLEYFMKGVKSSVDSNLLHAAFLVRTNVLFEKLSPGENYNYLSGLLIGNELKTLKNYNSPITICCGANLKKYYDAAIETLLPGVQVQSYSSDWVDTAVIRGQLKLLMTRLN